MTKERQALIDRFQKWLDTKPREQIIAAQCANIAEEYAEQLLIQRVSKRLSIKLEDWHYQCGDGCCDLYGTEITLNGKKCDNQYAGDDIRTALEFILTELGYKVDIDVC